MKRTVEHQLEYESILALRNLLPSKWIVRDINPDYGIDIEIIIVEGENVTNQVLWLQIKSTASIKPYDDIVSLQIKTKNLKYYEGCRTPVIILYYIKSENIFYYLFAQEYIKEKLSVDNPNWRRQKTITLKFPINSKLETDCFNSIATDGYLYIIQQQLNIRPEGAQYWLDGIPKSDDKELKDNTRKAFLYLRDNKYYLAIEEFENIFKFLTVSPIEKISILLNLGNAYSFIGQNNNALKNYNIVLNLIKTVDKNKSIEGKSAALNNIGLIYLIKGELDNALKYFQDSLKIHKEIGNKQGEAGVLGNIGHFYSIKGDIDEALQYVQNAQKINQEFGYREGEAINLGNIGLINFNKGNLDEALKYFHEALKIHKETYKLDAATGLSNIGLVYRAKGNLDEALKYLQDAVKIFDKLNLVKRDIIQKIINQIINDTQK